MRTHHDYEFGPRSIAENLEISPTVVQCQTQAPAWLRSSLRLNCRAAGTSHPAFTCSLPSRHTCELSAPAQNRRLLAFVLKVLPRAPWCPLPSSNLGCAREGFGTPGCSRSSAPQLCAMLQDDALPSSLWGCFKGSQRQEMLSAGRASGQSDARSEGSCRYRWHSPPDACHPGVAPRWGFRNASHCGLCSLKSRAVP